MLITDYLFDSVKPIWKEYLNHDFLKDMGNGTLDKTKFKNYLIQDYIYLKEYAKVYAMALVKCDSISQIKYCQNGINGILEDESAIHICYLKNFGEKIEELEVYKIQKSNEDYTNYMKSIALTGDLLDTMVSLLPCTWSYYYIAKKLKLIYTKNLDCNFYKDWINAYSGEGYKKFVDISIDFVNSLCENINENKKEKLKDIFIKASIHEMKFWDMAYEEVK